MGVGLEIYRDGDFEAGALPYFDSFGGYILGSQAISANGSVTDANFANGNPFWYVESSTWAGAPVFSFSGTTLSWTLSSGFTGTLYYGIR